MTDRLCACGCKKPVRNRWARYSSKACQRRRHYLYTIDRRKTKNKRKSEYERCLRLQSQDVLGGKCVRCGISDWRILEIDHRNGDGAIERRYLSQIALYKKVLEDPTHYQLLCRNCNWEKALENGELTGRRRKPQPSHLPTVNLDEERKAS
jgi:hypothetical protein